mmetsp:Transcript_3392/g.7107  ORF Transcript_3392/g.7107 Transcript_3392/m.7107 type:complete len:94 (+) Transcript_3392:1374-1655(+)
MSRIQTFGTHFGPSGPTHQALFSIQHVSYCPHSLFALVDGTKSCSHIKTELNGIVRPYANPTPGCHILALTLSFLPFVNELTGVPLPLVGGEG